MGKSLPALDVEVLEMTGDWVEYEIGAENRIKVQCRTGGTYDVSAKPNPSIKWWTVKKDRPPVEIPTCSLTGTKLWFRGNSGLFIEIFKCEHPTQGG